MPFQRLDSTIKDGTRPRSPAPTPEVAVMEFSSQPKHKPPPNYRSRAVQIRLFLLVSMLMVVVLLAEKAADPKMYAWMGFKEPEPPKREKLPAIKPSKVVKPQLSALEESERSFWRYVIRQMTARQRRAFYAGLYQVRHDRRIAVDRLSEWTEVVNRIDKKWKAYKETAFLTVAQGSERLTDQQKADWLARLDDLKRMWAAERSPAFQTSLEGRELDQAQIGRFAEIQRHLDQVYLDEVSEGTTLKSGDRPAWFRLLEHLRTLDDKQLRGDSLGYVDYIQLTSQPDKYRGRVISLRGKARRGYAVQARPGNVLDIDQYYVVVVKPNRGSNNPVVVYCLDPPAGLPELTSEESTDLEHDVEISGFFFKNYLYTTEPQANGQSTHRAPLMLARTARWMRPPPRSGSRPSTARLATYGLFTLGIGVLVSLIVYMRTRWPTTPVVSAEEEARIGEIVGSIDPRDIRPPVHDALSQLSDGEERNG